MRLLLVDDDDGLRALLRTTFEVVDIEVDEARDAREAELRIAERRPDVMVLDVLMPGESGLDFCRRLKADPATSGIPVVLLTGSDGGGRCECRAVNNNDLEAGGRIRISANVDLVEGLIYLN